MAGHSKKISKPETRDPKKRTSVDLTVKPTDEYRSVRGAATILNRRLTELRKKSPELKALLNELAPPGFLKELDLGDAWKEQNSWREFGQWRDFMLV